MVAEASPFHRFVDLAKITEYLLSEATPKSRSRRKFLLQFGFRTDRPKILQAALLEHPANGEVVPRQASRFGEHCNVAGPLCSPDGRNPSVTTCWTKRLGEHVWRFTTLLPR